MRTVPLADDVFDEELPDERTVAALPDLAGAGGLLTLVVLAGAEGLLTAGVDLPVVIVVRGAVLRTVVPLPLLDGMVVVEVRGVVVGATGVLTLFLCTLLTVPVLLPVERVPVFPEELPVCGRLTEPVLRLPEVEVLPLLPVLLTVPVLPLPERVVLLMVPLPVRPVLLVVVPVD